MGKEGNTIKLYAMQADIVLEAIKRDGVCYSKKEYVRRKYGESAQIFMTAYSWYVQEAARIVPQPEGAEYPYWAFRDLYNLDQSGGGNFLELEVPREEVVLFDLFDWNRILCLKYLGENQEDDQCFKEMLERCGMSEDKVMLTSFYPRQKQQILASWKRLFRHHEQLIQGNDEGVRGVQAGLWRIKKEWITVQ